MKIDEFKDNIDDAYSGLIKKRSGRFWRLSVILRMIMKFADDMRKDFVGQYAAQSAFYTVLSSVPFLMLVILCLKYFISVDVTAVTDTINSTFPAQVSVYLSQIMTEIFYRSESVAALSVTVIAALWSSSKGTMAIYCGLNQIAGYVRPYNWIFARVASFFYNIVFVLVIVVSAIVLVFGNTLLGLLEEDFLPAHYALQFIVNMKRPVFIALLILAFTGLYKVLPQRKMSFLRQLPGAVTTALGWLVFSSGFRIYIEHFSRYSVLYGSLTAVVLLMLWIFFCLYLLLIGAEINKHIENGFFGRVWKKLKKKS